MTKETKKSKNFPVDTNKKEFSVQSSGQTLTDFLKVIAGQIYDETTAMRGYRIIKPETYSMQIGADEA